MLHKALQDVKHLEALFAMTLWSDSGSSSKSPVSGLHDVRGRVLRRITVELLDA